MLELPITPIGQLILECFALSILSGLARLFLLERTVIGGWKQFFGGMVFGSLVGYLLNTVSEKSIYFNFTGKMWRLYVVVFSIFGKEILFVCKKGIVDITPVIGNYLLKQGQKLNAAYRAYKNYNNENDD